jgi:hypothetical protein
MTAASNDPAASIAGVTLDLTCHHGVMDPTGRSEDRTQAQPPTGRHAEHAEVLPGAPSASRRLAFVAIGASGDTRPLDIHRLRTEVAAKKLP